MANINDLSRNIQNYRQQQGLTQDDLSDRAGISYSTLSKIERGAIKNPSVFTIEDIAKALKIPLEDLLAVEKQDKTAKPKFLFLDLNGVLVHFFHKAFVQLSRETGITVDKIESAYWHYNDATNRGDMSLDEFNKAMSKFLDIKKLDWKKYYLAAVEPVKEMQQVLIEASKVMPVGILSNTAPDLIPRMIEMGLIPDIKYSCIVDSSQVHAIKPEPEIYRVAEQLSGYKGSEIFFVDDSRTNLMAAEKFNWHVLWFDDYQQKESADRVREALGL